MKTQTPIVPVTIIGSSAILAKGDWRIRSGQIEVTVGASVAVENYRPGALRVLSVHVQELIENNLQTASQLRRQAREQTTATVAHPWRIEPSEVTMEPLRIIPLGGLGEFGLNMMLLEYGDAAIAIDCGLMFPGADLLGIDLVIPDVSYLLEKKDRLKAHHTHPRA